MSTSTGRNTRRRGGSHRLDRQKGPSLRSWEQPISPLADHMARDAVVDLGWGRLIFGHTFESNECLARTLASEQPGRRDVAWYLRDPHVVLSILPQDLFLDPSHTYRLWGHQYRASGKTANGFLVRRIRSRADSDEVNRIYASRGMVTCDADFMLDKRASKLRTYLVAERIPDRRILGTVTGIDHVEAFNDPENGASLWCLAVDAQADSPGVGEHLLRHLVEHYLARGRAHVDLSVMHDNSEAIRLYEKIGFTRVPVFCVKRKNSFNEPLFTAPRPEAKLNPYAKIITDEARRRGIRVEIIDEEAGYFNLQMGGRSVICRESLTELTTAVAMSRCDDKRVTRRLFKSAGLHVPAQQSADGGAGDAAFLGEYTRVVVKPARGEQGAGISVDVREEQELRRAVDLARSVCPEVILEEMVDGQDLRVIVIDDEVVASAVRKPAMITGTGEHTVRALLEKYNRRRAAATGGESRVPLDDETLRCLQVQGCAWDDVPAAGQMLLARKTANLHTGGTIHDVTGQLHGALREASVRAARAIGIPVVGLDLLVPDVGRPDYVLIEANERPGLANHEPQPTAERFIDFLFPQTTSSRPVDSVD